MVLKALAHLLGAPTFNIQRGMGVSAMGEWLGKNHICANMAAPSDDVSSIN